MDYSSNVLEPKFSLGPVGFDTNNALDTLVGSAGRRKPLKFEHSQKDCLGVQKSISKRRASVPIWKKKLEAARLVRCLVRDNYSFTSAMSAIKAVARSNEEVKDYAFYMMAYYTHKHGCVIMPRNCVLRMSERMREEYRQLLKGLKVIIE